MAFMVEEETCMYEPKRPEIVVIEPVDWNLVHCGAERPLCDFLAEVDSRADTGLVRIKNGCDLVMWCLYLCG